MSGKALAVPPGRAGRLWLRRRLEVAERGAEVLDRKLRILRGELAELRAVQERTAADWDRCRAEAELWLLRAALLGGRRSVRVAADGRPAEVTITYRTVMGIRHPSGASCRIPEPGTWDGPVLGSARQAHRAALQAAVGHAAAAEAVRLVEAEALATQYRLRAITDRRIPRLERALAEVTLAIEEQEIADATRLRLAAGRADRGATGRLGCPGRRAGVSAETPHAPAVRFPGPPGTDANRSAGPVAWPRESLPTT